VAGSAGDRVLRLLPPFVNLVAEVERFLGAFDAVLGRLAPALTTAPPQPSSEARA